MDKFNRDWIIRNAVEELREYGDGMITVRGLHYRLVSRGMTNSQKHYKRVVAAMTSARWDNVVGFDQFADKERDTHGSTDYEQTTVDGKVSSSQYAIKRYFKNYHKNRWENQPKYVEVWIEKKALQAVFEGPCDKHDVLLAPCKGYPSLTFLKEAYDRFTEAENEGLDPVILYFGDYDPSGEDIPRSVQDNLARMGVDVKVERCALLAHQVEAWNLPPAPAKATDSRTLNASMDVQIELDAVEPRQLRQLCEDAILSQFDQDIYEELLETETEEKKEYQEKLRDFFANLDLDELE